MNLPRHWLLGICLIAAAVTFVSGCSSTGTNFDESRASEIQKDVTTREQLIAMFGQPNQHGMDSDGNTHLTWMYTESRVKGKTFIPYAGPFVGGTASATKMLNVVLGPDDKVVSYSITGGAYDTRGTTQKVPKS